ncbi:MAG: PaaI family thioesterase [Desulfobacteraceae bacterium]|jgi:uncharacterized protein (TIGR00369 family)|nr:PaaI family thioesterase [Desulfobacteraceae bacterium]
MASDKDEIQRIRTITWEDPKISARDVSSVSGLNYLKAIKDGKISQPPIARLVGYRIVEVENGTAVFQIEPGEYLYNPFSTVHGGILSTLLDTSMTAAVLSTLPMGKSCSTLEIKVNFVRPVTDKTELIQCQAEVIHSGKRTATAFGKIFDDQDRLVAHGTGTWTIF